MRRWALPLTTLAIAVVAGLGPAAPSAMAQNPFDVIKRKAEEAKRKADEIRRKADSTRQATSAAKAAADSVKDAMAQAVQRPGTAPNAPSGSVAPAAGGAVVRTSGPSRGGVSAPSAVADGAPKLARSSAKVDEQVILAGASSGTSYSLSPKGVHLAAVALRGSRSVVVYDGADGPKFDAIQETSGSGTPQIVFSGDGRRYAYIARSGQDYVIVVDGKELVRGSPFGTSGGPSVSTFGFTGTGKHFYHLAPVTVNNSAAEQLMWDGRPAGPPFRYSDLAVSPDGEHYAYTLETTPFTGAAQRTWGLIVDGKPATFPTGAPMYSADGRTLYTKRTFPNGGGDEVLANGQPFLRSPAGTEIRLHAAPAGPLVLGVVVSGIVNGRSVSYLTVGNQRVPAPAGECAGPTAYIDAVTFTDDGRHWAAICKMTGAGWVIADGTKGQSYDGLASDVQFLADGRPVYLAGANGKTFVVVGDKEYGPYQYVRGAEPSSANVNGRQRFGGRGEAPGMKKPAAFVVGNHFGFLGQTGSSGSDQVAVVDGKSYPAGPAMTFRLSPDGSRFSWVAGIASNTRMFVDGVDQRIGLAQTNVVSRNWDGEWAEQPYAWSPDGKHIAWPAVVGDQRGIAVDGRFLPLQETGFFSNLTFSPDGKHLFWVGRMGSRPGHVVFLDGEVVMTLPSTPELENVSYANWEIGPDGALTFVAQVEGDVKRFRVTPNPNTSVQTLLAKMAAPR